MKPSLSLLLGFLVAMAAPLPAAETAMRLWRLDCGRLWIADLDDMSDTYAYAGRSKELAASCYLLQHGEQFLLWDTGLARATSARTLERGGADAEALARPIAGQLAEIGVEPSRITHVGISHYHFDHIGQAAEFPQATLLIGKDDVDVLARPGREAQAARLAPWLRDGAPIEKVVGDHDIFGDGSAVMLGLPGHTPGHHGLLVRLPKRGPILLSGDVAHFRENLETSGVPSFNADRARSVASMERFREIARNLGATVVIQHEILDIPKLPPFPEAAE